MNIQDKIIGKLVEIDTNVKELMIQQEKTSDKVESLTSHVEGFVKLHETLDCEVAALHNRIERSEDKLKIIETKLKLRTIG